VRSIVAACAVALGLLSGACGDAPSHQECEKLLDHVLEIYTQIPAGEQLTPQVKKDLEEQKKAVAKAVGKTFLDTCEKTLPRARVLCGLKARTEADLAKCEEQ